MTDVYAQKTKWSHEDLSEYLYDFCLFTADNFKSIDPGNRCRLWNILKDRCVYVPEGRIILVSGVLLDVVKNGLLLLDNKKESKRIQLTKKKATAKVTNTSLMLTKCAKQPH